MRELLEHLLKGLIGEDFQVEEMSEGDRLDYKITVPEEKAGLVIGKSGRTIKAIRSLMRVRATLEKKLVFLTVN